MSKVDKRFAYVFPYQAALSVSESKCVTSLFRTCPDRDDAATTACLQKLAKRFDFDLVFVFDTSAKVIGSTDPRVLGADASGRAYVQTTLKGEASQTAVFNATTRTNSVITTSPVFINSGAVIGGVGVAKFLQSSRDCA